ncbi:hypothetical protein RvY_07553-2 [Ramazzottius varieornatus]|uniref:Equilibrative nucleoside transporter 1 n=1 Tax=Ramazzottius varieornatus TaxID=947166 RepID=A0A1D1V7M1_RAMVA|nr:hypothetical protein RvY_07553-2 [Ramazzottius varieornatus]
MSISVFPGKEDQTKSGTLYFSCALFILLVAFGSYFLLPLSKFYRYYINRPTVPSERPSRMTFGERLSTLRRVFGMMRLECWNVFFVFFVTLSVFPNIMVNVQRYSMLDDEYFRPVITILNFSVFAFIGNLIPFACSAPGPRYVWIPILARIIFFPFFLMCNYNEIGYERRFDVWFTNDYVYAVGGMLLAVTSGYFSSLAMMYASSKVKDSRLAPMAGQLAGFFLVLGIFAGLMFSWLLPLTVLRSTSVSPDEVTTPVSISTAVSTLATLFSSDATPPSSTII